MREREYYMSGKSKQVFKYIVLITFKATARVSDGDKSLTRERFIKNR